MVVWHGEVVLSAAAASRGELHACYRPSRRGQPPLGKFDRVNLAVES